MPVHRIPRANAHEDIRDIERQAEVIVSAVGDGPDHLLVFTRYLGQQVELRGVS